MDLFEIEPYRFYLLDYSPEQWLAMKHYHQNQEYDNSNIPQKVKKGFIDIEVFTEFKDIFPEPKDAAFSINAVTYIDSETMDIHVISLKHPEHNIDINEIKEFIIESSKKEYNIDIKNIHIYYMDDEIQLFYKLWEIIHEYDPLIIMGFNSDYFDIPYIFNRMLKYFNEENIARIVSKFNSFTKRGFSVSIPDFKFVDLKYLYKPGEGLGFGRSLDKYNLDTIAEVELKMKKVEHENVSLDELYVKYFHKFLYYNVIDVMLLYLIDKKKEYYDFFNTQRRYAKCCASAAYHGRSILGEQIQTYNSFIENKIPRSFIVKEKYSIPEKESEFQSNSLSLKYYGALVKDNEAKIHSGLIVDLDQTSMYPSIDKMFNIGYTTYVYRIFDPSVNKFLDIFGEIINTRDENKLQKLKQSIFDNVSKFMKNVLSEKKEKIDKNIEYINHMMDKLFYSNLSFENILNASNYFLFKTKLIPLLDIIDFTFSKNEYNQIVYDYVFNPDFENIYNDKSFYVQIYPTDSISMIYKINYDQLKEILTNYIPSFTGCVFYKHDDRLEPMNKTIVELMSQRSQIKAKMKNAKDEEEYNELDKIQKSIKIILNSISYGVNGLVTYRYNDRNIANTITICSRILIKTAQYITEEYMKNMT